MSFIEAIILALIEGLTEFLPVSSTGHMVIASSLMGMKSTDFVKLFMILIQLGAILAVVVLYFKRFFQSIHFYLKLIVAFIPSAILGLTFAEKIDQALENPITIAIVLIAGGFLLLFIDNWLKDKGDIDSEPKMSFLDAFKIGLFQCLAVIFPGTSRSGATIIGGMAIGLRKKWAAEFSFFLALPTMLGASLKKTYDYLKEGNSFSSEEINLLIVGNIIAFVVALLAIKSFIHFLNTKGFKLFGWYRIIVGTVILILLLSGVKLNVIG